MGKSKFAPEDLTRWKREINPAPIFSKRMKLRRENSEFVGCCPDIYHVERIGHPDKNPSFKIWKMDDGVWGFKCFSCGANGNVFQFVQAMDKISFSAAVARVLEEAGIEGWQDGQEQTDSAVLPEAPKEHVTFPLTQYQPAIEALIHAPEAQTWLRKRGIMMETARRFKIGFIQSAEKITSTNKWKNDGWILFPTLSADGQTITAVKYRSVVAKKVVIDGKENSGILRAPHTSTTLYNLQTVTPLEDVWIVEGEPDTMVLAQAGLTAVGYPMAEYKPTGEECDLLSLPKRRFLAGDSDKVGAKAMATLKERLRGETFVIKWPNNRKDANDVLTNECGNDLAKFKVLVEDLRDRAAQTEPEPILRSANTIPIRRISWLWNEKIPLGKITLFAGNPDNGKSLASTSVAAITSNGDIWPGETQGHEPADVLMLLGEDDLEDTAVPRLLAAQANMKRVHFLEAVRPAQKDNREVRLDMDLPAIEKQLERNPKIRLIIVDPISNYLGEVNMMAEQEVRTIMIPLKRLAEKHNIAIVIVMHLNKKNELDAISRVGGAMAFIGVARCSWLFVRDPKEETAEGEEPKERKPDSFSMLRIKNNLVSSGKAGMAYTVETRKIEVPNEPSIITPFVVWGGIVDRGADDALGQRGRVSEPGTTRSVGRPPDALQKATKWLGEYLQDGAARPVKIVRADAKLVENITADTLDRAYLAIGGTKAFKSGKDWFWRLDPINATRETVDETTAADAEDMINFGGSDR